MATLEGVLTQARELGFLGPGPVEGHIEHAAGFVRAVGAERPDRVVDLGTGGGVPGLILALAWPEATVYLVEGSERRAQFLQWAVSELGLEGAVVVAQARAETAGRDPAWRSLADVVTARSFGRPSVTAECAAPLLRLGGRLIVSEPPDGGDQRWPEEGLATLGLRRAGRFEQAFSRFQVLRQNGPCPEMFPRRVGVPTKRPLF